VATSPLGNRVGVCFHNCYGDTKAETQAKIELACQAGRGFSLIEFDIISNDNVVRISHDDGENGDISLVEALENKTLKASNLILFLEIKENWHTEVRSRDFMRKVLTIVSERGYVGDARPLVLRAITNTGDHRDKHLLEAQKLLLEHEFSAIRDYVRFHTLFTSGSKDVRDGINMTKTNGFHGVEVDENTSNLFGALMHAKLLGLGAGVLRISIPSSSWLHCERTSTSTRRITISYLLPFPIARRQSR
jgi:hypothetical protein